MMKRAGKVQGRRTLAFTVGYSERVPASPAQQTIITGQVVQCQITTIIQRDHLESGPTDVSTVVAYPAMSAFLNAGNIIPPTFQLPQ